MKKAAKMPPVREPRTEYYFFPRNTSTTLS